MARYRPDEAQPITEPTTGVGAVRLFPGCSGQDGVQEPARLLHRDDDGRPALPRTPDSPRADAIVAMSDLTERTGGSPDRAFAEPVGG